MLALPLALCEREIVSNGDYPMKTALYLAHVAAEAAMIASNYDIDLTKVADEAHAAYRSAISTLRAQWTAIPYSDARSSAETNAEDTEDTAEDELRFLEVALGTYEMNMDCGEYDAAGRAK